MISPLPVPLSCTTLLPVYGDEVAQQEIESEDHARLKCALLESFKISAVSKQPEKGVSLKPFILLFDEYYIY